MNMWVLTVVNGLVKTDGSLLITPATSFHKSHGHFKNNRCFSSASHVHALFGDVL